MSDLNFMSPEALRVIELVQKLLNLANKNPNPEEAASAAAKAQKMLAEHNLEMSTVEEASGLKSGKREEQKLLGGMYQYQRDLWKAVGELNFCLYWNQMTWQKRKVQRRDPWDGTYKTSEQYAKTWQHRLVGRSVNVMGTKLMGQYLEGAVDRLLMDRLREKHDQPNSQRWSSWAVAFREGAISDVVGRLYERREHLLAEEALRVERERDEAMARATAGVSTENALALADLAQSEYDANMDHLRGEGWSARQRARRAEAARLQAEEEARYAKWAAANPEEAAAEERKREEADRRYWARYRGGSSAPERASDKNYGAYREGRKAGASISIDQQVGTAARGLLK